jgi:hypothetical protein
MPKNILQSHDVIYNKQSGIFQMGLRNMYGQPDITAEIKSRRLDWLGHMARMEKGISEGHPGGR